jgi:hypothetical protein
MNHESIKAFAFSLGYDFSDEDCREIANASYHGETIEDAVNDFLNAYER